jgi:hypothetical protein
MRFDTKALAVAAAALWGGCMLFVGLAHLVFPAYGTDFLRAVSSIYPGFDATPSVGNLLIGTVWGIADGAVGGFLFGWLYNLVDERLGRPEQHTA